MRDVVKWNTVGPRVSAVFDVTGDGKTAAKASAGRYYYVLSTGGGGVSNVNPQRELQRDSTPGTIANGDHKFQLGEQTGTPVVTRGRRRTARCSRRSIRTSAGPYTDEYSVGVDRELDGQLRSSARSTPTAGRRTRRRRRTRDNAVRDDADVARWIPGIDGVVGTADDGTYGFYPAHLGGQPGVHHQRPERRAELQGPGDHGDQAAVEPLADAGRLHAVEERSIDDVSVDISPNFLINANGNITDADERRTGRTSSS